MVSPIIAVLEGAALRFTTAKFGTISKDPTRLIFIRGSDPFDHGNLQVRFSGRQALPLGRAPSCQSTSQLIVEVSPVPI